MKKVWLCIENIKIKRYNIKKVEIKTNLCWAYRYLLYILCPKKKGEIVKMKKNNKGVTLIALVVTIIILLILASIGIGAGKSTIKKAQLENLKTNMLLIQAKSKEYVEEAGFKIGTNTEDVEKINSARQEVYTANAQLGEKLTASEIPSQFNITDSETNPCYFLTDDAKKSWGLDKIETKNDEKYLIQFNETEETVEVYNTIGYEGKYKLSEIEQIEE